jgi:hypothetical protein
MGLGPPFDTKIDHLGARTINPAWTAKVCYLLDESEAVFELDQKRAF